jgi:pimeloyl-ACP methyl ester carboxylesterase
MPVPAAFGDFTFSGSGAHGQLHYLDSGTAPEKRAGIVFLHGWGTEARTFLPSLRILANKRRVVAPDLPGFGQTKWSLPHWDYDESARVIQAMILYLGLEHVHLVGHSIGAGICMRLSIRLPDRVVSLTLVDSAGIPFGSFSNLVTRRLIRQWRQAVAQSITSPKLSLRFMRSMLYNFSVNRKSIVQALDMPIKDDIRTTANQIQHPTLILWGERDRTTPLDMGRTLARHIRASRLVVVPGPYYHDWSMLHPAKFAQLVGEFIDGCEPPARGR